MKEDKNIQKKAEDIQMDIVVPQDPEPASQEQKRSEAAVKSNDAAANDEGVKEAETIAEQEEIKTLKEAIQQQAREDEQPASTNFTLRKILGGDILYAQLIRRQIWLMILIVFFIILYISNRYSVQKDLLEIDRLNTQLKDAKYKALSSSSMLTEKCRESHVLEILKTNKDSTLKMPDHPPFIIQVPR